MAFKLLHTMCLLILVLIISPTFCMSLYPSPTGTQPPIPTPPTTTPPNCPADADLDQCRIWTCINGVWTQFESVKSEECCLKYPNPICMDMFPELFAPPTTTGLPPTTTGLPPPTSTLPPPTVPGCPPDANLDKCTIWECFNGIWSPFESVKSEECCLKRPHPMCREMFPELFTPPPTPTPPPTTTSSPTTVPGCPSDANLDKCTIWGCFNGIWQPFEPVMSEECCLKRPNPMCRDMFPGLYMTKPMQPPTTKPPVAECEAGWKMVKGCTVYLCIEGRWKVHEISLTKECCYENKQQPGCEKLLHQVVAECEAGRKLVKGCTVYLCIEGRWKEHEISLTKECCYENKQQPGCEKLLHQVVEVKVEPMCKVGADKRVEDCIVYVCIDGQWRKHGYYPSKDCCLKDKSQKVCQQLF